MKRITMTSAAALLALPLATLPAAAQDTSSSDTGTTQQDNGSTSGNEGTSGSGQSDAGAAGSDSGAPDSTDSDSASGSNDGSAASGSDSAGDTADEDQVVVSVEDAEITAGDVRDAIASLPPQVQQNPPDVLIPFAVEQLVLRELILAEAQSQNLSEDPEVQEIAGDGGEEAVEAATVRVYVQRAMEEVTTDEAVQSAYDEAAEASPQPLPPLEEVRPQIEQQIQQQRLLEIRDELRGQYEVVYYDENGEPREETPAGESDSGTDGASSDGNAEGAMSGSGDTSGSSDTPDTGDTGGGMDGSTDGSGSAEED
ncbi:hypothetical protein LX81_00106 [Palleronia aestuarii]|uniref:Peptidyl-prolyl cis-trans isomerase SurA n=1 Tax=Palleronia aestuarii TaxID=568105 RepID=A0A2W7QCT4_9RHOB|nr:hypothetical protein [Palleronia aestuarii]PZX19649.1 hypothetical protein LX81_00106 [Palleronia aestuarii]